MRILIVEDDRDLAAALDDALRFEGYATRVAYNGLEAVRMLAEQSIDIVLLDRDLPIMSGDAVMETIASNDIPVSVLMLTAAAQVRDRINGLELGADDYLPKPFHLAELSARIRSVLRRHQRGGYESLDAGNVRLWPDSRRVEVAGREVELLRKEYDILYYFMSRPNHMVDKATLAEAVWGDHIDQADNFDFVYAQMKNLRRRLHDAQADIEIRAVYGFGYKLVAP